MYEVFQLSEKEDKNNFRTTFARDRDRILYSKDFLRLGGKTQIFVEGYDDHMRNRLTHTLEVAQISNKISKYFGLSIDLTDAIAYGHDIGHTPFGHAGERILNKLMNGCFELTNIDFMPIKGNRGFKHNWQGIRVLRDLNKKYTGEIGFEISKYTEWGILKHTGLNHKKCKRIIKDGNCGDISQKESKCKAPNGYYVDFYEKLYTDINNIEYFSLEALIVEKADEIAQRHHDLEDGLIGGLISLDDLIEYFPDEKDDLYGKLNEEEKRIIQALKSNDSSRISPLLKKISHLIISIYVRDLITNSKRKLKQYKEKHQLFKHHSFHDCKRINNLDEISKLIDFSEELKILDKKLKSFLKDSILNSFMAQSMDSKAKYIILKLVNAYIKNPQYLPKKTISDILSRIYDEHSEIITKKEKENVREFIADNHFIKLKDNNYVNFFLRGVCDFIAGMTDDFAYKQFNLIFGTEKITNHIYK